MLDDSSNRLIWIAVGLALIFGMFETYNGTIPKILESVTSTTQASIPVEHTAYAYSADGTDRFSTVYPNLNLLDYQSNLTLGKHYGWAPDAQTWSSNRAMFGKVKVTPGAQYTISSNWSKTDWLNVYGFQNITDTKAVTRFGTNSSNKESQWINTFDGGYTITKNVTMTIPDDVNYLGISYCNPIAANTLTLQVLLEAEPKLEEGSTATSWMPSASEVKDSDYPTYIGTYTDHSQSSSNDPTKYTWKKRD